MSFLSSWARRRQAAQPAASRLAEAYWSLPADALL